jgi:hypothetical protein
VIALLAACLVAGGVAFASGNAGDTQAQKPCKPGKKYKEKQCDPSGGQQQP